MYKKFLYICCTYIQVNIFKCVVAEYNTFSFFYEVKENEDEQFLLEHQGVLLRGYFPGVFPLWNVGREHSYQCDGFWRS